MSNSSDGIPAWIEPKLFENVLRETLNEFSSIINFKAFHALAPGENYATVILKVEVEALLKNGARGNKSFILKVAHNTGLIQKEFKKWDMFSTESGMYHEVVPEFEKLYHDKKLNVKFGAKSYKLATTHEYILLENLSQRGFRNAPRQNGLDLNHCKSVLSKLAQWHAASAVRMEREGPYQHKYARGMFIEDGKDLFRTMLNSSFKHLLTSARQLPNQSEYLSQLENLKDDLIDLFYKQSAIHENEFKVLNHGDCWSNNIMFQYDEEGNLRDTYFVDLQIPSYNSPAQDLLYFIITSAQLDIKINKFDYMIKYYHDHLVKHLSLLQYPKALPTLKELHISLIRHGCWGLFATVITMPAVLCDPTEKASIDNLIGDCQEADKFKQIMFTNERFIKHLETILPWLCYRGVF